MSGDVTVFVFVLYFGGMWFWLVSISFVFPAASRLLFVSRCSTLLCCYSFVFFDQVYDKMIMVASAKSA